MKFIKLALLVAMLFITIKTSASNPPQPSSIPPPVGAPVPIDSNMIFLFASGIILGAFYKLKNQIEKL